METEQFLARVVPPGNYAVVTFKSPGKGMGTRFFPRSDLAAAAGFVRWATRKGMDAWFACASYRMAVPDGSDSQGKQKYTGERKQENVQALRAFWIDIDVAQGPGAGKDPTKSYPTQLAAAAWVKTFSGSIKLPPPNLWVNSGYGLHVYWVLEDAMAPADWQPHADAFYAALNANGAHLDAGGFVADSARILRPAGGVNMKDQAHPAPVSVLSRLTRGEYPNALVLQALQPFIGMKAGGIGVVGAKATGTHTASAHSGSAAALSMGTVSPIFAGRAAATAAAAQANLPARREYLFAEIGKKCAQVRMDLATNGAGVNRPIWYLGHLSLAHFCSDGPTMAHEISKGDARYTPAGTDAAIAAITQEKLTKGGGAPTCAYYNATRSGVCQSCSYAGKLTSPLTLGIEGDGDLPDRYRRHTGALQCLVATKDGPSWSHVVNGDVYAPSLTTRYQLKFTYEFAGQRHDVFVDQKKLLTERGGTAAYFSDYGMTLDRTEAPPFGDFVLAWINSLRALRVELHHELAPFGWMFDQAGASRGFAVGGTVYRPDGTSEESLQATQGVAALYQPTGTIGPWQTACDLITKGRIDLQTIVATAFGAPLMRFTGQPGLAISIWSRDSGVGKSSAFMVGQTVWAAPNAMCSAGATINAVRTKVGLAKVMPLYWDEIKVDNAKPEAAVNLFFDISQGRDKSRLDEKAQLREVNEWETLFVCSGNRPLMDYVLKTYPNTEAGAVRCFEIFLDKPKMDLDTNVQMVLADTKQNHGHAGRIYAKYLAENEGAIKARVKAMSERINISVKGLNSERYFVAGVACIVVGAAIATSLGLVKFDVRTMLAYLEQQIVRLRGARGEDLIVNDGQVDLDELFGRFMAWASPRRLDTTHFLTPGQTIKQGQRFVVQAPSNSNHHVVVHVGHRDRAARIERNTFDTWCQANNFSGQAVLREMQIQWGATKGRSFIGAGSLYATAKMRYIELPLVHPDLAGYLDTPQAVTTVGNAPVAPALAGNQPKV